MLNPWSLSVRSALLLSLTTAGAAACQSSPEAAGEAGDDGGFASGGDGGGPGNRDGSATSTAGQPYVLCDGSDDVRLAINETGGGVPQSYAFTNPHGYRFLYVTGKCEFVADGAQESVGGWIDGTLSAEQAATLSARLGLSNLSGKSYHDSSCPDASYLSIGTTSGYADCSCGCDVGAPSDVLHAVDAVSEAFTFVAQAGRPLTGPVGLLVVTMPAPSMVAAERAQAWPFSFTVDSVAVTLEQQNRQHDASSLARTLSGDDANAARSLRSAELARDPFSAGIQAKDGAQAYWVYTRDQLAAPLEAKIDAYHTAHSPYAPKPLAPCSGERVENLGFSSATVTQGGELFATTERELACDVRLCWDGSFLESLPVQARLEAERIQAARSCQGEGARYLATDLTLLKERFRASYPDVPVEVRVILKGYAGGDVGLLKE